MLLIVFPVGFPNYDTIYALVWGRELAHGISPDYGAALPPTPHPLTDLLGLVTSPFGEAPITVTMIVAYVSLGLIAYFVYRLGALWFDRWIGVLAAVIVLTRAPFLSNGLRAYVDLPYIALCLGALAIEAQAPARRLAGPRPAGPGGPAAPRGLGLRDRLLALAGLRPPPRRTGVDGPNPSTLADRSADRHAVRLGAWVAAGARRRGSSPGSRLLALAGPILWVLFDAITTGNPLYSLTGTQETVETLKRQTGPVDLVLYGPRRLGEVMQWPGMVGALGGLVLGFAFLRRRSALGIVAVVLALVAFALLAAPGWRSSPATRCSPGRSSRSSSPWRCSAGACSSAATPGAGAGRSSPAIVLLMFLVWLPNQWDLDSQVHTDLTNQGTIESDLTDLVDEGAFAEPLCGPIAVPNHRAVPRLAFGLEVKPTEIVSASEARESPPTRLLRRPGEPLRDPQLHPRPQRQDPLRTSTAPAGFQRGRPQRVLERLQRCGWPPSRPSRPRRASIAAWVAAARSGSARLDSRAAARRGGRRRGRSATRSPLERESRTWPPRVRSSLTKWRW